MLPQDRREPQGAATRSGTVKWSARATRFALASGVVALLLMQVVPYGRDRANPAVLGEPAWDTPETRALFVRACADCHSNQTRWPWYSHVAPVSWFVVHDVDEGRAHFNVSEWGRDRRNEGDEAAAMLLSGEMPLQAYTLVHPEARLTPEEKAALVRGLAATFGNRRAQEQGRATP